MKKTSLQTKFVVSISVITLITLIITSVITFVIAMNLFWSSKEDSLQEALNMGQMETSAWFSDKELLLTTVAEDMRLFGSNDKDAIQDYFSHYPNKYSYMVDVYLSLPNNEMYSGTYWIPEPGYDAHSKEWYKNAQAAGGLVYTDPYMDFMSKLMVITLSMPVVDKDGRDMGVIAMDIKLDSLVDMVNAKTIQNTSGRAYLLDRNRNFIVHENAAFLPKIENDDTVYINFDQSSIQMGKDVAQGDTVLAKNSRSFDGIKSYIAQATIPQNDWAFGFSVPVSDYNGVFLQLLLEWIGISVLLMLVAITLAIYVAKKLLAPIKTIIHAADRLSQGDVHVDIHLETGDELSDLSGQFEKMIASTSEQITALQRMAVGDFSARIQPKCPEDELSISINSVIQKLSGLITEINRSARQVSDGSSQIANGAQALALGSTEQAAAVQQLSASLETVLASTEKNAAAAQTARNNVEAVLQKAGEGNTAMSSMVKAVEDINASSTGISKIIKVIDDIAFQTNILALNAAVEAARAGQHGKGFAVVADEVRNLAAKSAAAANETTSLIGDSVVKASDGMRIAKRTNDILADISQRIGDTVTLMHEIADTSGKQVAEIEQINIGVSQVSEVVQQNSATAEESAAGSEQMSAQAAKLETMMSMFRVEADEGATPSGANRNMGGPPAASPAPDRSHQTGISLDNSSKY